MVKGVTNDHHEEVVGLPVVSSDFASSSDLRSEAATGERLPGSIMIQYPIVTQHHSFSRKINRKNSDIQIGVMQNFSRFGSIRKYFRINLVVNDAISVGNGGKILSTE